MDDRTSWEIDDLVEKEAGKIYECLFCLGLPKNPKTCSQCEHLFCTECLNPYTTATCPYRCVNPVYNPVPKIVKRAILELKIKCRHCGLIMPVEQLDKHTVGCMKPKCACLGCSKLEEEMKQSFSIDGKKFCSLECKYAHLTAKCLEKTGTPENGVYKNVNATNFVNDMKKVIQQLLKDPDAIPPAPKPQPVLVPVAALPVVAAIAKPAPAPMDDIAPEAQPHKPLGVPPLIPISSHTGLVDFKWDPECCAQNVTISDGNTSCFLMEGGYCFRTVLGTVGFSSGIAYWEIHADTRTENELKIGVIGKKNFNLNTAFCDYEYGWGYYGLGQLRHGNNSAGSKYGKTFKNTGVLGVCLDMIKGELGLALNNEYMGVAFKDEGLKKGPMYPAVSLLHKAGCKLVTGKPLPSYFVH